MDRFDRYVAVFFLGLVLATVAWGVKDCIDAPKRVAVVRQLKLEKECWERKAQEHTIGQRDRRC